MVLAMRPRGFLATLAFALSGASLAAPDAGTAEKPSSLPLVSGGSTLVLGVGARIESLEPESGKVIGSVAPIPLPGFSWERFLRRGRFLLAEGHTKLVEKPVWHSIRGLALFDDTGRLRWTDTHAMALNRVSRAVFLDEEGNVAYDKLDGPILIKADGTWREIAGSPVGPVVHGPPDLLPVRSPCAPCAERVEGWAWASDPSHTLELPPKEIARRLLLRPSTDDALDGELSFVLVVDVAPENELYQAKVKSVARMPLPRVCRDTRQWVRPTMSPRHWILECQPELDDRDRQVRAVAVFIVDVAKRRIRRIRPPTSDLSDVPREVRWPDTVEATVVADGTILASVWNHFETKIYLSAGSGNWKRSNIVPPPGPPFAPEVVCGRLTLQPTLYPGWLNGGCGSCGQGPATLVQRPDGTWLELPYRVESFWSGSCSDDREVVAFVADGALTTARLDRSERKIIRAGVSKEAPFAWLQ